MSPAETDLRAHLGRLIGQWRRGADYHAAHPMDGHVTAATALDLLIHRLRFCAGEVERALAAPQPVADPTEPIVVALDDPNVPESLVPIPVAPSAPQSALDWMHNEAMTCCCAAHSRLFGGTVARCCRQHGVAAGKTDR